MKTISKEAFLTLTGHGHVVPRTGNGNIIPFTVGKKYKVKSPEGRIAEVRCTQDCPYSICLITNQ